MKQSNASSNHENATSDPPLPPSFKQAKRNVGRVADYFAILGIGSCLELKNKNLGNEKSALPSSSSLSSWTKQQEEEEECSMVERFYREITDLCLLTVYVDEDTQYYLGATISATHSDSKQDKDYDASLASSLSTRKKSTFGSDSSLINLHLANQQKKIPSQISGYAILSQTLPAGDPSQDNSKSSVHATYLDNNTTLNDSTLNNNSMSLSMNTTFDSKHAPLLWKKNSTFDADLSPQTGFRSLMCSTLLHHREDLISTPAASFSIHDTSFDHNFNPSVNIDSSKGVSQKSKSGLSLLGITSKLRDQLSPLLATKSKAVMGKEGLFPSATSVSSLPQESCGGSSSVPRKQFYIGYRRRGPDEMDKPAIANVTVLFCKIHISTILQSQWEKYVPPITQEPISTVVNLEPHELSSNSKATVREQLQKAQKGAAVLKRGLATGADVAKRVVASGGTKILFGRKEDAVEDEYCCPAGDIESSNLDEKVLDQQPNTMVFDRVALKDLIEVPSGYDELLIPDMYQMIQLPVPSSPRKRNSTTSTSPKRSPNSLNRKSLQEMSSGEKRMQKTFLLSNGRDGSAATPRNTGAGIEVFVDGNTFFPSSPRSRGSPSRSKIRKNPWSPVEEFPNLDEFSNTDDSQNDIDLSHIDREVYMPSIVNYDKLPGMDNILRSYEECDYEYIPMIAFRRQRVSEEERFHEDPSIVDLGLTFSDVTGKAVLPPDDDTYDVEQTEGEDLLMKISSWNDAACLSSKKGDYSRVLSDEDENDSQKNDDIRAFGLPKIICKRNTPIGFLDTPFATSVLDRFPKKNYKGVPLPEEELPMFCYPTGCRLFRAKYQDAPLPEYYGFVVKNERGDSIYGK